MPTLEQLEGDVWPESERPTPLIRKCHALRKKDADQFTVEDLRLMLGQGIGLRDLVPRALEVLEGDPFAMGDMYDGDLLKSLTREQNWPELASFAKRLDPLCRRALATLGPEPGDVELPDGRIIYRHIWQTLTNSLTAYLNRAQA